MNTKKDNSPGSRRPGSKPSSAAPGGPPRSFANPQRSFEGLDTEEAASLISTVADMALVVDRKGVIQDLSIAMDDLPGEDWAQWVGQPWTDFVTVESRPKVEQLLRDAAANAERRWRHVNHPIAGGQELPMLFATVPVGQKGRMVAIGRDMRALAGMQQRLVDAQQSLERDYWRLRHLETRYRLLFEVSGEPILIVEAAGQTITEANPAALALLDLPARRLIGQPFPLGLEARGTRAVQSMLARVKASGRTEEVEAAAEDARRPLRISASPFRHEDAQYCLIRMAPVEEPAARAAGGGSGEMVARVIDGAPDGFVVTDLDGRILMANAAFVEFCQLGHEGQLRGESLERWLGRPGVDLGVLQANLKQSGSVRLYATALRGELGSTLDVEISAVAVPEGNPPCLGFTVRHVGRRIAADANGTRSSPRSVEQLTKLVGRVPLKDLVRESTDLIEQLCIEAALELTRDNRASAAELLGLSRQSLYVKLRRYGLGDLGPAE